MDARYPLLALSLLSTAAIVYYSSLPIHAAGLGGFNPSGELAHFAAFAVYAAIVLLTASKFSSPKPFAVAFAVAVMLGAATETIQFFVPGRVCDALDWAVDAAGALAGLAAMFLLNRFPRRKP